MKISKIVYIGGIILVIGGIAAIAWFFFGNFRSELTMKSETNEFMEELEDLDPLPIQEAVEEASKNILEGNTIAVLEFPAFDQKIAVKEGTTNYILSISAGHMMETEQVWDSAGTCAIAAHNNTYFKNLKKFKVSDKILVYTRAGVYQYEVYRTDTILPTDLSVIEDVPGQKTLTLITCDLSGDYRVIVMARGGVRISGPQDI